ncbi:MAG: hypothetical protein AAF226_14310 [Verrucomicrobiota bacterium]
MTSRRSFVSRSTAAISAVAASMAVRYGKADDHAKEAGVAGKIRHSACKWCYPKISLEDLCIAGKEFGLESIELLMPDDFPTIKKRGILVSRRGTSR